MKQSAYRITLAMTASALAVCAHAQAAPQAPATTTQATTQGSPDDIVVTASRRSERLRDTPLSISVLGGDQLNHIGVEDARSYLTLVPGVSLADFGVPGEGTIIIRGLNSGSQQTTNTAATYIDDAPFSASGFLSVAALLTPDPDIADLDHIEVLKGPQGTLYGANSLGGLVRIISNKPDLAHFSGYAQAEGSATEGGAAGYALRGTVNVPLVGDTLALRVNGEYRRIGGFVDNAETGQHNVNSSTISGGHASLRWQPDPALTVDLTGMIQTIHNNGADAQENVSGTLTPLYGRYDYASAISAPSELKYRLATLTANYDAGPVTLIATGSYARYTTQIDADYSLDYLPYLRAASPYYAAVLPANGALLGQTSPNMRKWTGELRAVSKRLGRIEFVAGAFYTNEHNVYPVTITALDAGGAPLAGTFPTGVPLSDLLASTTLSNYEELAGYVNGTFYIIDNLDLGGGVRYAHNTQFAETGGPDAVTFYVPRATSNFHFSDSVATYLATIRFRPTRQLSFYLRAASGYRPGGPQTNATPPAGAQTVVNPDKTWNYEGGVKGSFGPISVDASVYHIDWKDIQLNTLYGGTVLGGNGGNAKVDGFEMSVGAKPTRQTTVSANLGYTHARMTSVDPGAEAAIGVVPGDRLPLTPAWTFAFVADQTVPLGTHLNGDFGATLRYRSDMPSSFPGAATNPSMTIPNLSTLDLRAGLNFTKFAVQARIDNVFNTFGYSNLSTPRLYAGQDVPTGATVIRPRTFVLAVSSHF